MFHLLLNWCYRIVAPGHPRGWLDFDAVFDENDPLTCWIHCHGMERWNLPNLEMVEVPYDLRGYAHGILFDMVGYMKAEKPIRADENFGGALVGGEEQRVYHTATLRAAAARDGHAGFLRVVDADEPAGAGFPCRLFAAHICALADRTSSAVERERMFRRAIEIFPGAPAADAPEAAFRFGDNQGNYAAWEGLGYALVEQGRTKEGLDALEQAVWRHPAWARDFSRFVREEEAPAPDDPRDVFWRSLDVDALLAENAGRARPSP